MIYKFCEVVAMALTILKLSFNLFIRILNWPLSMPIPVLESADVLVSVFVNHFSMHNLIVRELAKEFFSELIFLAEYEFTRAVHATILLLTYVNVISIV